MRKWLTGSAVGLLLAANGTGAYAQDEAEEEAAGAGAVQTTGSGETTTTGETTTGGDATSGDAASGDAASGDFNRELLTIEEDVNGMKERVFRAKATLQLLSEVVAQGSTGGSRTAVTHVQRLGRRYRLESVAYFVDGQGAFSKSAEEGGLDAGDEIKVFEGAVPPGSHTITVTLGVRGNGWGVFNYMQDYEFTVQSTHDFTAEEGKSCQVKVVIDERKGMGHSFTERPGVTWETRCLGVGSGGAG